MVKPGFNKVGALWFVCNDTGLTGMGEANCSSHQFQQTWDEGNVRKRCEYQNGRMLVVDMYCVNAGKLMLPGQLVMTRKDATSAMICSEKRNGTLVWQNATDAEIFEWQSRYVLV